ncbi:MAG: hypothetical protein C4326_12580 [Ignavibacteria bacterium]
MAFTFTSTDFKRIGKLLQTVPREMGTYYRLEVGGKEPHRKLALEIYPQIRIGKEKGNLISVYTETSHLQLHFCSGYVTSEMLGEVTFVGEYDGRLSGLIVEREGGCSLYANVDRALLSGDFTKLGPEVMLSGIALSLTDTILEETAASPKERDGTRKRTRKRTAKAR